ncbi:MAG: hypothetical protein PQJ61_02215 [Spirochaetales bacterium]|uniref:HEAT repeat domain-containing protein n=1 Tax=Candidatus Thalassospirochaeta sargassi TaxID=3119039 RepID=A0AAJ1MMM1_9SPIO|nr:hypothetical protein [Spirochaetales bacterium]
MNKRIFTLVAAGCLLLSAAPVFSNEMSAVWSRIYNTTDNLEARLSVMQNIVDLHDRDMEPVINEALKEIVYSLDESMSFNERQQLDDLMKMMIRELGSLKAVDSAPEMYKVMQTTEDEFLRAIAIAGMGNAGARDYADEIAEHLRYLNTGILTIENNEQRNSVVDACILSLERLKHPAGFEPVFFASIGRYARESVMKAERALQNMVEDPTDLVVDIIKADNSFEVRLAALGVEERSKATAERQTEAATAAIEVSLVYNAVTPTDREYQTRTKVKAAEMIRDLGTENEDAVEWLGVMLNSSTNVNELVISLQALGTYSSNNAVTILSTYLAYHSDRRVAGIQYKDERAIRECINAIANTGNPNGKTALMMVEYSNWSSQTIRMAKNALKNM